MADRLEDFQKFRTDLNEEILGCSHDALNVALIIGGSIAIPHLRRAFARMHEIGGLEP